MSRQAVTDAQAVARRLNHNEVDTWHLLSALLSQENDNEINRAVPLRPFVSRALGSQEGDRGKTAEHQSHAGECKRHNERRFGLKIKRLHPLRTLQGSFLIR